MIVPIIRATSCPSIEALHEAFSVFVTARFATEAGPATIGYIGRTYLAVSDLPAHFEIFDPFDYQCVPSIVRAGGAARMAHAYTIKPVDGTDIDRIYIAPIAILPLRCMGPRIIEEIRKDLINAWDGRDHLRKAGGRVAVADADTKIVPVDRA